MQTFTLQPHPTTPCPFITALRVGVEQLPGGSLRCLFEAEGTIGRLDLPAPTLAARADGLWRQTCCEIFLRTADAPAYDEFNFSPSGQWAAYRFGSYRSGMVELECGKPPTIACEILPDRMRLEACIGPTGPTPRPLLAALSAVLKDREGGLCYWALKHPPGKPDFHHESGFAATLATP